MSDTPMTDLFPGPRWAIGFMSDDRYKEGPYHGVQLHHEKVFFGQCLHNDCHHSLCNVMYPRRTVSATVSCRLERDISQIRRPCKLCLAALRKAHKEAESK